MIAKRYLKFYFWIDTISVLPFDYFSDNPALRLLGLAKVFRLFRLTKLISFMRFDTKQRSRIRLLELVIVMVTMMHWSACLFYSIIKYDYSELSEQVLEDEWAENYWMPPVDVIDRETNFYFLSFKHCYYMSFYYSILLVIGNDISP